MMMANVNFVVLKINDIDVGQLPQQQQKTALSMLLNEETDKVVLELKRKSCWNTNKNIDYDDIEISKQLCYLQIHHNTPLLDNNADNNSSTSTIGSDIIVNLHLPGATLQQYCMTKSTQTEDIAFYVHEHLHSIQKNTERLIEHEHNLFEQSLAPEIDIEEITLRKSDSNERLGITVCYSNAEDYAEGGGNLDVFNETVVTEVYISDIHPDSVAGRDGRLRQGDQILQINGKDIKTRPETETLIAENNNAVTLLVSRYLYADEDDFNDPSTNEDEDEVLVVEDDEDDDDEDDELYEENNMTYVNCVINNDCCINDTDELDKALMSQVVQQEQLQQSCEKPKEKYNINTFSTSSTHTNAVYQSSTLKCTSDGQKEKLSKNEKKSWLTTGGSSSTKCEKNSKSTTSKIDTCPGFKTQDDYETEHIYETIPEDPESEPFYCSPYDNSVYVTTMTSCSSSTITDALQHFQQKQRVAQWLGIKPLQDICATTAPRQNVRSSNGGGRSSAFFNKNANGTVRSAVTTLTNGSVDCLVTNIALPGNSQLEDQDNSSSAYNTGGSNNSVSPLTLMLNPKSRSDQNHAINLPTNGVYDDGIGLQQIHQKTSAQQKTHSPKDKSKITSPKGGTFLLKTHTGAHKMAVMDLQMQTNVLDKNTTSNKETNVHRNMLLKQHLFNQKLSLEKSLQPHSQQQRSQCYYQQQTDQIQCPQFTAPNLSQYHFVSSQEVNNLSLNNKMPKSSTTITNNSNPKNKEEDTMVWKVKRRPDGTRYIVRRPAKNRVIKERNTRLNVERLRNDITTTEDDTISEIKTGRYWTREERKKHIEKAKERRQQQQQLVQQQQNKAYFTYDDSTAATLCIGDVTHKVLQDSCEQNKNKHQQYLNLIKQQQQKASHQQQHYQLQFNSAEDHKHSKSIHNMESPTKKSLSTLPTTSEEFSTVKANIDHSEVLNTIAFTSSEHNQINNSLQSVTTT